jgi:hypothetical protein
MNLRQHDPDQTVKLVEKHFELRHVFVEQALHMELFYQPNQALKRGFLVLDLDLQCTDDIVHPLAVADFRVVERVRFQYVCQVLGGNLWVVEVAAAYVEVDHVVEFVDHVWVVLDLEQYRLVIYRLLELGKNVPPKRSTQYLLLRRSPYSALQLNPDHIARQSFLPRLADEDHLLEIGLRQILQRHADR